MILRLYRINVLILIHIIAFALAIPCFMVTRPFKGIYHNLSVKAVKIWARLVCLAFGIKVHMSGAYQRQAAGFIVSNHLCYTDIPVIASITDCVFVSKDEVRRWPIIGFLSAIAGTIFVNRNSGRSTLDALRDCENAFSVKRSIVLFPEATTSDGVHIRQFKSTFFNLPERLLIPVQPLSIKYFIDENKPDPLVPWHDNMDMASHLWRLLGQQEINVVLRFCEPIDPQKKDGGILTRKELARLAEERVKEAYHS